MSQKLVGEVIKLVVEVGEVIIIELVHCAKVCVLVGEELLNW